MENSMMYAGGCHCGKVRYETNVEVTKGLVCNCSICSKRGSILSFTPESQFNLLKGANDLTAYFFNKHKIKHQFCSTCGILPFANATAPDGTPTVAINLRTIDNIDVEAIHLTHHDGKSA